MTNRILDHTGRPMAVAAPNGNGAKLKSSDVLTTMNSYLQGLGTSRQIASVRARDPFQNHPWVYAAVMAVATTASQAPYTIYTESEETLRTRRKQRGATNTWKGHRGRQRRAMRRYSTISPTRRLTQRSLEPDLDNPLMDLIVQPNPFQDQMQFFQMVYAWLSLRGELYIVAQAENGEWVFPGDIPATLWPMSPDLFKPVLESENSHPVIAGYYFHVPSWFDPHGRANTRIFIPAASVYHPKFPNPNDPLTGMSPITSASLGIEIDLLIGGYNRSVIENGGDPGGLLMYDQDLSVEERREILQEWNEVGQGASNAKKTRLLSHGFKYAPVSMSPKDMEYLGQKKWDREEILAALRVPPSQLGSTEYTNYATHLGEKKNFWDNNLIPLMRLVEAVFDATLLFGLPDSVVGLFDLKDIEALRSGLSEKVAIVTSMTAQGLHMPPDVAYDLVGLQVPEYPGSDKSLVNSLIAGTMDDLLQGDIGAAGPQDDETGEEEVTPSDEAPSGGDSDILPVPSIMGESRATRAKKSKRWKEFLLMEQEHEPLFKQSYRLWVNNQKKLTLARYDGLTHELKLPLASRVIERVDAFDLLAVLPDPTQSQNALRAQVRPRYTKQLMSTYDFTVTDVGGIPVFELDDPAIVEFFHTREAAFVNATPNTIAQNLERSIAQGISNGETVQEIRGRVAQVYDVSASSAKSLQIARTETSNFMNGSRDAMFGAQGITEEEWLVAGDEHTRETHLVYGSVGPVPRGTNYLTFTGTEGLGELKFPGDPLAPAGEVINCRCLKVPA